jgi:sialate O-acetylesterase
MPYKVEQVKQLIPENFYQGTWQISDSTTAQDFSAVGYYFGTMLQKSTQIPIGLINIAIGGTPTEAWMSGHLEKESQYLKALVGKIAMAMAF